MSTLTIERPAVTQARTMQAIQMTQFGGPEVLSLQTLPQPKPGHGEVLVRVKAAGVGPWDGWVRAGKSALLQPLPLIPGSDFAGVVAQVGPEVEGFEIGEAVYGVTNARFTGAYAGYAAVQAGMISGKPESLSFTEASSVPVVAVTAWQALFEQARVQSGQTVLIHGAGGNVGAYAVQMAKLAGAKVIATAGTDDVEYLRGLGADLVNDYRTQDFTEFGYAADVVIDLVGGETQARSFQALKPGGCLISAVSAPDQVLAARYGVEARFFLVDVTTLELTRIAEMIDAGELKPRVGLVLPLTEARTAHEILDGKRPAPRGKIVLETGAAGQD